MQCNFLILNFALIVIIIIIIIIILYLFTAVGLLPGGSEVKGKL